MTQCAGSLHGAQRGGSDDVVPYFEDGLSDGSDRFVLLPSRGSVAPRREENRRNCARRSRIKRMVKARVVKVLGEREIRSDFVVESATKDELTTVRMRRMAPDQARQEEALDRIAAGHRVLNQRMSRCDSYDSRIERPAGAPIMMEALTTSSPLFVGPQPGGWGILGTKRRGDRLSNY